MNQRDVMGLVIARLYFGTSPDKKTLAINGRVLKWLHSRGRDWDSVGRVVEGLALRRDCGELGTVGRTDPVSLLWLWDKDQAINQASVCEDAYYQTPQTPVIRGGAMTGIASLLSKAV